MRKINQFIRLIISLGSLAIFIFVVMQILQLRPGSQALFSSSETTQVNPYPIPENSIVENDALVDPFLNPNPYPSPTDSIMDSPLPGQIQMLIDKRSELTDVTMVTIDRSKMWLIPSNDMPKIILGLTDVATIYGWNFEGTKLLFGRGLYETSGELAKATELWIYDSITDEEYLLVDSKQIWSASWSPVNNLVAFCEYGEPLTVSVVSLDGKTLFKKENLLPDLTWSPDGSAIAVRYSGPKMFESNTRYSVIGIWWLEKDELQLLNDFTREDQSYPFWTIDGNHIVFHRSFGPGSEQGENGLYIFDIATRKMSLYPNDPKLFTSDLIRSPKADGFVYSLGREIYFMEYDKAPIFLGIGSKPVWLPDGRKVMYYDEMGSIRIFEVNTLTVEKIIGGNFSARTIYLQPNIFFKKDAGQ